MREYINLVEGAMNESSNRKAAADEWLKKKYGITVDEYARRKNTSPERVVAAVMKRIKKDKPTGLWSKLPSWAGGQGD